MSFKTQNPANEEILSEYSYNSLSDALEKIRHFGENQKKWMEFSVEKRAGVLKKIAQKLRDQKSVLAKQAALEMGKPITQGEAEVEKCAVALETMGNIAIRELAEKEVAAHYKKTILRPEPYGLVFSVQPWNFPYWQALRMSACAWMAGNLVVLKHSDSVAGCAELIEKVAQDDEAGALLLNLRLTHEDAAEVIKSPFIRAVTFTGSTKGGKSISQTAGGALKKCVLELGGSDAYIVLPDCDLELAAKTCAQARLINSGQSCIAGKRFFVHDEVFQEFKKRFKAHLSENKIGDPLDRNTHVGPLAAGRFLQALNEQVKRANFAGAKLEWTQNDLPKKGFFMQLGILDFGSNLKVFENEEIFGPVASLYRFTNLDEVIDVINGGPFGLGGAIFSKDENVAARVARKIQVGTFVINTFVQSDARVPFGGVKESGLGREMGVAGLQDFVSWKVIGQA